MRRLQNVPGAVTHWYGKDGCKKNRKVGHITVCAESVPTALARVRVIQVRQMLLFAVHAL